MFHIATNEAITIFELAEKIKVAGRTIERTLKQENHDKTRIVFSKKID
jgi:hypothetical protein